jgi:hypothetical protein
VDPEVPAHNQWQIPHDVQIIDSTLLVSEEVAEEDEPPEEQTRSLALGEVVWSLDTVEVREPEGHQLVFENCRFELDRLTVEPDDSVYAMKSVDEGGTIIIRSSDKDPGFTDWFAPQCPSSTCSLEP